MLSVRYIAKNPNIEHFCKFHESIEVSTKRSRFKFDRSKFHFLRSELNLNATDRRLESQNLQ